MAIVIYEEPNVWHFPTEDFEKLPSQDIDQRDIVDSIEELVEHKLLIQHYGSIAGRTRTDSEYDPIFNLKEGRKKKEDCRSK